MIDPITLTAEPVSVDSPASSHGTDSHEEGFNFSERYREVLGILNETFKNVDWAQMGRIGKVAGISAAAIVALIMVKGILDTINVLPLVPGLLELLGVVVLGHWSWQNLTTSEKRTALTNKIQNLRMVN